MNLLKLLWNCLAAVCVGVVAWIFVCDVAEYYDWKIEINTKGKTR